MKTARFEARLHVAAKLTAIQRALKKWQDVLQRKSHDRRCECDDSDAMHFPSHASTKKVCYFCYNPADSNSDIDAKLKPALAQKSKRIARSNPRRNCASNKQKLRNMKNVSPTDEPSVMSRASQCITPPYYRACSAAEPTRIPSQPAPT